MERIITVRSTRLDNAEKKLEALGREKEEELKGKGVIKVYDSLFSRILIAPSLTDRKLGYFSPTDKLIVISEEILNSASWHDTENIFIHELGHALAFRLYKDLDHSASFRDCCSLLGLEKGFEKSKVKLAAKETEKEKDRIRKLLALSSSPFENEAAEAIKKAKSLMARGSISLDEDREERIYMVPLYQAGRFPYYARVLMNYISESDKNIGRIRHSRGDRDINLPLGLPCVISREGNRKASENGKAHHEGQLHKRCGPCSQFKNCGC